MARRKTILSIALIIACLFTLWLMNSRLHEQTEQHPHALHDAIGDASAATTKPPIEQGPPRGDHPSYIFAFGDSYTNYGFESEGAIPTTEQPFGNRASIESHPDQPATYNLKWLDFIINELSPPQTVAFNFARGASTVDASLVPPQFWGAKELIAQGREFVDTVTNQKHKMHTDWTAEDSAFIVWMGINDVANTAEDEGIQHVPFYQKVVHSYLQVLDTFYAVGGRRFIVIGLPPLDRTPSLIKMGPPATFKLAEGVIVYNELLANNSIIWNERHPLASIQYLDTQPIYHKILDSAPDDAICTTQDKSSCMWVDMFHPSVKLQEGVAEEVERLLRKSRFWT